MKNPVIAAVIFFTLLPCARAQDMGACDKIFNDSTASGGLKKYGDAQIDASLCVTSKAVLDATMSNNQALKDSCTPAMSAVMREMMRRGRDTHEARKNCKK